MLRRQQYINIPTEIVRAVACIVEYGSFTKAAERLGLTQPAISAQIKRLQNLVGGTVFEKFAGGVELSERGRLLLPLVRKMLEANDQILQIGGAAQDPRPIRVGLSFLYAEPFMASTGHGLLRQLHLICDNSSELQRGVSDGYIDVAALLVPSETGGEIHYRWTEDLIWLRSRHFTLSPGSPVPLVGWPGILLDQIAIKMLEAKQISYRLAFSSYEPSARLAAVRAGIGVMVGTSSQLTDDLVAAKEYYLPQLAPVEAGIVASRTADDAATADIIGMMIDFAKARSVVSPAPVGQTLQQKSGRN